MHRPSSAIAEQLGEAADRLKRVHAAAVDLAVKATQEPSETRSLPQGDTQRGVGFQGQPKG